MLATFNSHRPLLFGIAYRMLGRVSEAEDVMQELWLRWRKQDQDGIRSPKAWLVSAVTRLCIDRLRLARHQREDYYGVWLPEPLMATADVQPDASAELSDSLTMAFMLMLESLGPDERAVFLLREVFGYEYAEVAAIVNKTEANCRQIARSAKVDLQGSRPKPAPPTPQARRLVEEFLAATTSGRVEAVLALLADDSKVLSDGGGRVKAAGRPILGADRVSRFLIGIWPRFVTERAYSRLDINGTPGLVMRLNGDVQYAFSFDVHGDRIHAIYIHCNPEKLRHLDAVM